MLIQLGRSVQELSLLVQRAEANSPMDTSRLITLGNMKVSEAKVRIMEYKNAEKGPIKSFNNAIDTFCSKASTRSYRKPERLITGTYFLP